MMFQLNGEEFFKNEAAIWTEVRAPQQDFPEHSHDFHELVVVSKGAGQHVLNDVPMNLSQNLICFISPRDRHLFESSEGLFLTNILFKKDKLSAGPILKELLPKDDDAFNHWFVTTNAMGRISHLIAQMDQENKQMGIESKLMKEALFQQLVVEISRGRLTHQAKADHENVILQILDWIAHHYDQDISVADLSEQFQVSSRTLSRKMKQMTNLSLNNYVHRVRINQAMNKLQYSEDSITEIAFQVGYKDSNYFSTKFKQFTNRTPSDFR